MLINTIFVAITSCVLYVQMMLIVNDMLVVIPAMVMEHFQKYVLIQNSGVRGEFLMEFNIEKPVCSTVFRVPMRPVGLHTFRHDEKWSNTVWS